MLSTLSKFIPTGVSIPNTDLLKPSLTQPQLQQQPQLQSQASSSASASILSRALSLKDRGDNGARAGAGAHPQQKHEESQTSTAAENESAEEHQHQHQLKSRRRRKEVAATETFIFVRPPPSKTNHPLNLQVQLVAASGKERQRRSGSTGTVASARDGTFEIPRSSNTSRETFDEPLHGGVILQRTSSLQSTRSDTESTFSSSSTYSTTATGSSSNRRMIPLYNLHAHNVLTNVITDAGTDAKIAKFFKRGLEIMGLAILEPVEIWGTYAWNQHEDSLDPSGLGGLGGVSVLAGWGGQASKTSSNLTRTISPVVPPPSAGSSTTQHPHPPPPDLPTVQEIPSSPATPKSSEKESRRISFGNLFKKKKASAPLTVSSSSSVPPSTTSSIFPSSSDAQTPTSSNRRSIVASSLLVSSPLPNQTSTPTTSTFPLPSDPEVVLQPQVLGLQAVLQSAIHPPKGRPSMYVWVVRKWIKGSQEGILGAVADSIGGAINALGSTQLGHMLSTSTGGGGGSGFANSSHPAASTGGREVELRFEWKRSSKVKSGDRRKKNMTASTVGEAEALRRHSTVLEPSPSEQRLLGASSSPRYSVNLDAHEPSSTSSSKRLSFQGPTTHKRLDLSTSTEHLKHSRANSPNPPASVTTNTTTEENHRQADDGGEESDSDIEDSERPWNCYLHIRSVSLPPRSHGPSRTTSRTQSRDELHMASGGEGQDQDQNEDEAGEEIDIRLRIACLAPAPHHPRVIAQVKTPYPLPDVVFDSRGATLRDRVDGQRPKEDDGGKGRLTLLAEEIKDVVSCTGLWLIVREGYGGLARKRKGDGWRLRG